MELEISDYCNRKIECSCGMTHYCPIETVLVAKGALASIPALTGKYSHILVVADGNTWDVCGGKVYELLGKAAEGALVYERDGILVPDEEAVAELEAKITDETDFVVGVGSGVINDLCKYATFGRGLDYAIVATAPSMDGYASSGAAMIVSGMKVTFTTHTPRMIIADTDVLKNAPSEMITSGYGDIIGKFSSLNDWRLSALVNGEIMCERIYSLVMNVTTEVRDRVAEIAARDDSAIEYLMKALILSGISLSLMSTTRPGSGSEHHLAHFFEITGLIHHKPHFVHGTDVGYATAVTAAMREELCAIDTPERVTVPDAVRESEYRRIYGNHAAEVAAIQNKAGFYKKDLFPVYKERWGEMKAIMKECPTADEIVKMLSGAGFDMNAFIDMYGKEKIRDAMFYAKDLKERYTVLWPYYNTVAR